MSKKGFVPAAQPATKGEGPNIKINKLTNTNGAPVGDQTVGGASGTDYIFTGVNPGSKSLCVFTAYFVISSALL